MLLIHKVGKKPSLPKSQERLLASGVHAGSRLKKQETALHGTKNFAAKYGMLENYSVDDDLVLQIPTKCAHL